MSIINSYDNSEEIVKAEIFTSGQKSLPENAIVCFKPELIEYIKENKNYEEYSEYYVCGEAIKIYKTNFKGKDVIIYKTLMGGPATVSIMEELHSRGVNKFIIFGSCGQLTSNIKKGAFIIPEQAYRDEGTSYHYIPASDFIEVDTSKQLADIFEKLEIPYEITKTWTTDAIYKETKNKTKDRINNGCKVVEMECASIMAFAKARNVKAFQFLYTEDTLYDESWDTKSLNEDRLFILKECLNIAFEIIK